VRAGSIAAPTFLDSAQTCGVTSPSVGTISGLAVDARLVDEQRINRCSATSLQPALGLRNATVPPRRIGLEHRIACCQN
jgi:hypothetical protein